MNLKTAVNSGLFMVLTFCMASTSLAQTSILKWKEVTNQFGPLPASIKVFESENTYQDSAFKGFYVEIDTKDKNLYLDTATFIGSFTSTRLFDFNLAKSRISLI